VSKKIWKFDIPIQDVVVLPMPVGAEVLSVGMQGAGSLCLWAIVQPMAPSQERVFYVCGTGNSLSGGEGRFIGTVQTDYFVWHVFEAARP
jgi:hypothetical protein